jgi:hypothetical protein
MRIYIFVAKVGLVGFLLSVTTVLSINQRDSAVTIAYLLLERNRKRPGNSRDRKGGRLSNLANNLFDFAFT